MKKIKSRKNKKNLRKNNVGKKLTRQDNVSVESKIVAKNNGKKQSKFLPKTLRGLLKRLGSVNKMVWIWLTCLVSIAVIAGMGANLGGELKSANYIELTFDNNLSRSQVQELLKGLEISVQDVKVDNNKAVIEVSEEKDKIAEKVGPLADNKGVVSTTVYTQIGLDLPDLYFYRLVNVLVVLLIVSFLGISIWYRRESWIFRLRLWSVLLVMPITFALFLTASGILASKAGLVLTFETFNAYSLGVLLFLLTWGYLLVNRQSRHLILSTFFAE